MKWPNTPACKADTRQFDSDTDLMKVKYSNPPNIDKIKEVFPNLPFGIVFAYGDTLYSPCKFKIEKHLMAHEKVHMKQQSGEPEKWWKKYLEDPEFRLSQEVEAYREQYKFIRTNCKIKSRIPLFLDRIARDLSSNIYGGIVDFEEAKRLIR